MIEYIADGLKDALGNPIKIPANCKLCPKCGKYMCSIKFKACTRCRERKCKHCKRLFIPKTNHSSACPKCAEKIQERFRTKQYLTKEDK